MTLLEIYQNKSHFACRKIANEMVLVPLQKNIANMDKILTLNEVGSFIWENIDGKKSKTDIIDAIHENFEVEKEIATVDFDEFIDNIILLMKS